MSRFSVKQHSPEYWDVVDEENPTIAAPFFERDVAEGVAEELNAHPERRLMWGWVTL